MKAMFFFLICIAVISLIAFVLDALFDGWRFLMYMSAANWNRRFLYRITYA